MTEDQAREAMRLIKKLDAAIALNEKIHKQYKEAWNTQYKKARGNGNCALNDLANIALDLQAAVVEHIRRDIAEL
ncbi:MULTISPECIES: hypothetical protein [Methylobacter]